MVLPTLNKVLERWHMRLIFVIAHTVFGLIIGYGITFWILSENSVGDSAAIREKISFFNENTRLAWIVGGISAAIWFVGSLFLIKLRHRSHTKNKQADTPATEKTEDFDKAVAEGTMDPAEK